MRRVFILALMLWVSPISIFAQLWIARYNGPGNTHDLATAIAVDNSGNVYVTGYGWGLSTSIDYATIKYNSLGVEQWVVRYNGPINGVDEAEAIAVDASSNVYVTGWGPGVGTNYDYVTIKYDSTGMEQWVSRYNGPGNYHDEAYAIAIDGSGNVYVTGESVGNQTDYATIKYNSSGVEQWVKRYDDPFHSGDWAYAIAVDSSGNVYVTGGSYDSVTFYDYVTIKYNSLGVEQWIERYNGPGNQADRAYAIAIDSTGNVYVTGYSAGSGGTYDYATVKYNSFGDTLWVARYNGPGNGSDNAVAIIVDDIGNVYVTGTSAGSGTHADYATIKYDSSGVEEWVTRYNGPGNSDDVAYGIAIDDAGNVYVTGASRGSNTGDDYTTVKYNSSGIEQWVERYTGVLNASGYNDCASAIAVTGGGVVANVYVTGWSMGQGTGSDYATIRYSDGAGVEEHKSQVTSNKLKLEIAPNLFIQFTTIKYHLPVKSRVLLKICDITGRMVKALVNEEKEAGSYNLSFDANGLSAGVYFVKFEIGDYKETKKLILIK